MRVFGAVFKKNLLEYVRYPVNFVFSLVMPIVWTLPIYFLIKSFTSDGTSVGLVSWIGTGDFYGYFMIGMAVSYINNTIFWNLGFSLKRLMDIGMLETTWGLPIGKTVYILAESFFSVVRLVWELALLLVIFRFMYGMSLPAGFSSVLPWFVPFFILMYGFGIGFASLVLLVKDANMMVDTTNFLINGITGTQNPPQVFPNFLLGVALAIPITYLLDLLRVKSLGVTPLIPPGLEIAVVCVGTLFIPIAGYLFFRYTDRRCRTLGNLGAH
jgi:ABC-2 type transport system permease protein